jgi:hypothetical protein
MNDKAGGQGVGDRPYTRQVVTMSLSEIVSDRAIDSPVD